MNISNRIKKLRQSLNIERQEMAKGIVSYSHYCNIESGKFPPTEDILLAISRKIDLPVEYFLKYEEYNIKLRDLLVSTKANIDNLNLIKADESLTELNKEYPIINSLYQESYYFLLKSYYYYRSKQIKKSIKIFESELLPLIEGAYIEDLKVEFKEVYYYMLGIINFHNGDYYTSYEYFSKQLSLIQSDSLKASTNYNIALALYNLNNIYVAIQYAEDALKLHLHEHQWNKAAESYILLGALSFEKGDIGYAEKKFFKGLDIVESNKLNHLEGNIYNNLGMVYKYQEKIKKSLDYFNISIESKKENGQNPFVSYIHILDIYLSEETLVEFNKRFNEAKEYCENESDMYKLKVLEAKANYKKNNIQIYENYMKESIKYFYEKGLWKYLEHLPEELGEYYQKEKKYKKAANYFKLAMEVNKKLRRVFLHEKNK